MTAAAMQHLLLHAVLCLLLAAQVTVAHTDSITADPMVLATSGDSVNITSVSQPRRHCTAPGLTRDVHSLQVGHKGRQQ